MGSWAGTVTYTKKGLYGLVSQVRWDKTRRLIDEIQETKGRKKGRIYMDIMESIRGFLVYMSRKYSDMHTYLKGLYLTIYSWKPFQYKQGWKMREYKIKLADLGGKWERVEEEYKPILLEKVPILKRYLEALGRPTEDRKHLQR